jgi:hypothetical protein
MSLELHRHLHDMTTTVFEIQLTESSSIQIGQ